MVKIFPAQNMQEIATKKRRKTSKDFRTYGAHVSKIYNGFYKKIN